jgi:hypothetical protein
MDSIELALLGLLEKGIFVSFGPNTKTGGFTVQLEKKSRLVYVDFGNNEDISAVLDHATQAFFGAYPDELYGTG